MRAQEVLKEKKETCDDVKDLEEEIKELKEDRAICRGLVRQKQNEGMAASGSANHEDTK